MLSESVTEAVEIAHRNGILTAASLMVGGAAAADAEARAKRLPNLCIGLHLVAVEGNPVLPQERLPDLTDTQGHLRNDLARVGLAITPLPVTRRAIAIATNGRR